MKKRGNGAAKDAKAPISLTAVQQIQHRIDTYEAGLRERERIIESAKADLDRNTAEILQIRGALGEAKETLHMLNPDGDKVVMPTNDTEVEAEV
mgnify:CR=1 FL=1|jgi:hypothetical protein|tara:strand:+ start:3526 stop:3807 length:282 start_codon:yes stop_codon:yes gene_type:complete